MKLNCFLNFKSLHNNLNTISYVFMVEIICFILLKSMNAPR